MTLGSFFIEWMFSYLMGLVAFWTTEIDGLYFSLSRIKNIFRGGYFPLVLSPGLLLKISLLLPFAYSFFVPMQLYLGKISVWDGIKGLGVQLVWILVLAVLVKIVWKRGLKRYEGVGI